LSSPAFAEYLEQHPGQPLIFAAQIAGFQPDASQPDAGIIQLNGETAFLWSHLKLYEQLGIQFDEFHDRNQIEAILNRQTESSGVPQ